MAIYRLQVRRGTDAEWVSANPILAEGEPGLATDTRVLKYGDGVTNWINLDPLPIPDDVLEAALASLLDGSGSDALDERYGSFHGIAIDNTNTAVAVTPANSWVTTHSGLLVTIPPTTKMARITGHGSWAVTTGGTGAVAARIAETTTGTEVERAAASVGDTFTNGTFDGLQTTIVVAEIEPLSVPITRSFRVQFGVFRSAGSLAANIVASGTTNPRNTFIEAVIL